MADAPFALRDVGGVRFPAQDILFPTDGENQLRSIRIGKTYKNDTSTVFNLNTNLPSDDSSIRVSSISKYYTKDGGLNALKTDTKCLISYLQSRRPRNVTIIFPISALDTINVHANSKPKQEFSVYLVRSLNFEVNKDDDQNGVEDIAKFNNLNKKLASEKDGERINQLNKKLDRCINLLASFVLVIGKVGCPSQVSSAAVGNAIGKVGTSSSAAVGYAQRKKIRTVLDDDDDEATQLDNGKVSEKFRISEEDEDENDKENYINSIFIPKAFPIWDIPRTALTTDQSTTALQSVTSHSSPLASHAAIQSNTTQSRALQSVTSHSSPLASQAAIQSMADDIFEDIFSSSSSFQLGRQNSTGSDRDEDHNSDEENNDSLSNTHAPLEKVDMISMRNCLENMARHYSEIKDCRDRTLRQLLSGVELEDLVKSQVRHYYMQYLHALIYDEHDHCILFNTYIRSFARCLSK